ncbi:MAG: hypothetical protein HEP71_13170 [Roseivirga sp.]|nr:hypothetical protein [Roseivirga sp.]
MVVLDETDLYLLFNKYEDVFLLNKKTQQELWLTCMSGEPACGKISLRDDWIVIGGESLQLWSDNKLKTIEDSDLTWIHDLRQTGDHEIEVLIDPWSEKPAIWRLNLKSSKKTKVRDFKDYQDREYTDSVRW